ncbi:DUF106 domain-containing protein [Candidatus Woesearchaeota archaeon]|nr:DUF106 domain-containing protein [Candidatus Woesearchaeota archaeon]
MVLNAILDPFLSPLLKLPSLISIIIISGILSFLMTLAYKKFTDQDLMKRLKEEIKEFQNEMKTLRDKPEKMMEVQKKAMETNMKYMMQSLKPTLLTFIPLILIFGWLHAHMGYYPIVQDQEFSTTLEFEDPTVGNVSIIIPQNIEMLTDRVQPILENKATFIMKGKAGQYILKYNVSNDIGEEHKNEIIIAENQELTEYKPPITLIKKSKLKKIIMSNKKVQPFQGIPVLQSIPWIGGFGWLGTYIIFSIIFSISLRKVMKVY